MVEYNPDLFFNGGSLWWDETLNNGEGGYSKESRPPEGFDLESWIAERNAEIEEDLITASFGKKNEDIIIGGMVYNGVVRVDKAQNNTLPTYTCEDGEVLNDHIYVSPVRLQMSLILEADSDNIRHIEEIITGTSTVEITVPYGHYTSMAVESSSYGSANSENTFTLSITFKEIKVGVTTIVMSPDLAIGKDNANQNAILPQETDEDTLLQDCQVLYSRTEMEEQLDIEFTELECVPEQLAKLALEQRTTETNAWSLYRQAWYSSPYYNATENTTREERDLNTIPFTVLDAKGILAQDRLQETSNSTEVKWFASTKFDSNTKYSMRGDIPECLDAYGYAKEYNDTMI